MISALFTDLHARLLPDPRGPTRTYAETVRHLERAHLDGTLTTVVTATLDVAGTARRSELRRRIDHHRDVLEELRSWCRDLGGIPALELGHLLRIRRPLDVDRVAGLPGTGPGRTRWSLVDFGTTPHDRAERPTDVVRRLLRAGHPVLVAHPERWPGTDGQDPLVDVRDWSEAGAALQVDAGSLDGRHGRTVARRAWELLDQGLVDVLASGEPGDGRTSPVRAAAAKVSFRHGPAEAIRLTRRNPRRILRNVHRADLLPPVRSRDAAGVPEPAA